LQPRERKEFSTIQLTSWKDQELLQLNLFSKLSLRLKVQLKSLQLHRQRRLSQSFWSMVILKWTMNEAINEWIYTSSLLKSIPIQTYQILLIFHINQICFLFKIQIANHFKCFQVILNDLEWYRFLLKFKIVLRIRWLGGVRIFKRGQVIAWSSNLWLYGHLNISKRRKISTSSQLNC